MQINESNTDGIVFAQEHDSELCIRKVSFPIGYSEASYHMHPNSFEYYIVLKGDLVFVAETEGSASAEDVVYFKTGERHRISQVINDVQMLLVKKIGSEKVQL